MIYRVEIAGRVFQGTDPRTLVRLAVQVRKAGQRAGETVRQPYRNPSEEAPDNLVNCA
jgi:hypothetical protein